MKASVKSENRFLEPEFFSGAETLREQLERALGKGAENGSEFLRRISSPSSYSFLLASADQVFTHDSVLAFLTNLRLWAREKLSTGHASTPQIHVYVDGCRRDLAPDATPARWHYLYSLTRGEAASVRLLEKERGSADPRRWGLRLFPRQIALSRITSLQLCFNQLLVHETGQAYALDGPQGAAKPLEGAILLHGYLW